jgi:hypothetical protein
MNQCNQKEKRNNTLVGLHRTVVVVLLLFALGDFVPYFVYYLFTVFITIYYKNQIDRSSIFYIICDKAACTGCQLSVLPFLLFVAVVVVVLMKVGMGWNSILC